jgi:hypothetical protein
MKRRRTTPPPLRHTPVTPEPSPPPVPAPPSPIIAVAILLKRLLQTTESSSRSLNRIADHMADVASANRYLSDRLDQLEQSVQSLTRTRRAISTRS